MSSKPCPNVLLLVDQSASRWSSQEDFCLNVARAVGAHGAKCIIAYSSPPAPEVDEALTAAGAALHVARRSDTSLLGFCREVRALCRRYGVGVIHLRHYPPSTSLTAMLPLVVPCPVILMDDTSGAGAPKRPLKRVAFRAFNRLMNCAVSRVIAPSHFVHERLITYRGIPRCKVVCIPNAVDLARCRRADPAPVRAELGLSNEQLMILAAGNLITPKGLDVLINAFATAAEKEPRAVLVIAGDGPERAKLEKLSQELGVSGRTTFLGQRSDMPDLLSAAAIFCCPSVWAEAFGWVNAEAMACEVPVVSTTTGAIPEIIEHGETGLLVPPRDSGAMAAAIIELLASPERRKAMGEAGRRRAEKLFDLRQVVQRYVALYADVAAGRSAQNTIT